MGVEQKLRALTAAVERPTELKKILKRNYFLDKVIVFKVNLVFRCNPLKGCVSRNRIFTHSVRLSVRGSKLIQSIKENNAVEG